MISVQQRNVIVRDFWWTLRSIVLKEDLSSVSVDRLQLVTIAVFRRDSEETPSPAGHKNVRLEFVVRICEV
jgi:hypothetical protein